MACEAEPSGAVSACHTTSRGSIAEPIATLSSTATRSAPTAAPRPRSRRVLRREDRDGAAGGGGAVVFAGTCGIEPP
ncbi:hypothetical protein LUR56_37235 [Streptomyces sp. MT29]|nr:hypothetical protein [Streptomyces sp. MT29]